MPYVPDTGDIVWLNFSPQAGHEQAGHRPALVLSPAAYNGKRGLMLCCPMTTKASGHPFEVAVVGARPGVILTDQIKSVDWHARNAKRKGRVSAEELSECRAKLQTLLF